MQGQDVVVAGTNQMWQRLFSGQERWGWEFTAPALPAISPEAAHEPVADQVYAPHDFLLQQKRSKKAWLALIGGLVATFFAVVFTGALLRPTRATVPALEQWATWIVLIVGVVLVIFSFFRTKRRFSVMKRRYDAEYNGAVQRYNDAYAGWRARIEEHDRREAERFVTAMLWHPLQLASRPGRIDVFGGTEDGWASLLTTIGAAQLASGSSMLLLDFTDMSVGENVAHAATRQGYEVHAHEAPRDLTRLGLLTGLDATELAEVLAESMYNLNRSMMAADQRGLHIDLLTAIAERLTGPVTFAKLVAGLQVLRRVYDAGSDETLAADELRKLNSYVDTAYNTDQVRNELQSLEGELRSLARAEEDAADSAGFREVWPVRGLATIATRARTGRHRRFLDHVVFHRALQELHSRQATGRETLVVAACRPDRPGSARGDGQAGAALRRAADLPDPAPAGRPAQAPRRRRHRHPADAAGQRRGGRGRRGVHRPRAQVRDVPADRADRQDPHARLVDVRGRFGRRHHQQGLQLGRQLQQFLLQQRRELVLRQFVVVVQQQGGEQGSELVGHPQPVGGQVGDPRPDRCPRLRVHRRTDDAAGAGAHGVRDGGDRSHGTQGRSR